MNEKHDLQFNVRCRDPLVSAVRLALHRPRLFVPVMSLFGVSRWGSPLSLFVPLCALALGVGVFLSLLLVCQPHMGMTLLGFLCPNPIVVLYMLMRHQAGSQQP